MSGVDHDRVPRWRGHKTLLAGVIRDGDRVVGPWHAAGEVPDERSLLEIGSGTKAFTGVLPH